MWVWLGAGLLLRFVLIYFPRTLDDDTAVYLELGRNLFHHGIYGIVAEDGTLAPALFRLPGYPIFLALLGGKLFLAELVQAGFDLLGCWLLSVAVARELGERAGEWALALGALCLFTAAYAATALTESLSIFAVCWGIYAFSGWRRRPGFPAVLQMAGAAALAMLLRPDGALLTAALLAGMVAAAFRSPATRRLLREAAVFCALACLPLAVWAARNERTFHVFQPLAPRHVNDPGERVNLGFYRWLRTWSAEFVSTGNVFWSAGSQPLSLDDLPSRAFDSPRQRDETAELFDIYNAQQDNLDAALDARFDALAEERIHAHPLRYYLIVPLARIADMLLRPRTETYHMDSFWWHFDEHPRQSSVALALGLINLAYVLAAVIAALRGRIPFAVVLGSYFAMRCLVLGTLENPEQRYSLALYPVLIVAAASLAKHSSAEPGA
jgi:hypothetical protein